MTEPSVTQATDAQIHALATTIQGRAGYIAHKAAVAAHDVEDRQWMQAQVALLASDVATLSRLVQPVAPELEAVTLDATQQMLLVQYAEVDRGQRYVAGADMKWRVRQQARAMLIEQGLIVDAPDGHERGTWLTDLGRTIAGGLEHRQRLVP